MSEDNKSLIPKEDISLPSDKELIVKLAFELKSQNRFEEAIGEFKKVLEHHGEDANIVLMLAMLMVIELSLYKEALPFAIRAVELLPESEKASLTLFHCYFDQNLKTEAEEEISRYVKTGSEINQYQKLFDENNVSIDDFI